VEKISFAWLGVWIAWVLAYIWISDTIFYLFIFLLMIDLTTGVMKGIMYKELSSSTFMSWLFKKSSLLFLVIWIAVWLKILWYDSKIYIDYIFGALTGAEIYSILWNVYIINTWKKVSEWSAIEAILSFFMNTTKNVIKETIKDINQDKKEKENKITEDKEPENKEKK